MIKIGILGCGKIAQVRHIPEYAENKDAQIVGFYDINLERAKSLAETYDGTAYETAEELLANPEIDAVSICTANFAHAELTIAALNAGKHVLCEKPMATTLADCEAMVEVSDDRPQSAAGQGARYCQKTDRGWPDRRYRYLPYYLRSWWSRDLVCGPR